MNARRSRSRRPPRRAILIVCEGSETEPCYFKALVRRLGLAATVEVEIRGDTKHTDPKGLVNDAVKLKAARASVARRSNVVAAFEDIWVVFDVEHPGNGRQRDIAPAVQTALARGFMPAISRPSFEVWYLLHDRPTPPGVACSNDCKPHLRALMGMYDKYGSAAAQAAEWALPYTQQALINGHRQDVFSGLETTPGFHIPDAVGTAVYRLVQMLVDMSSDVAGKQSLGIGAADPVPVL